MAKPETVLTDEEVLYAIFEARRDHNPFKRDGTASVRIARAIEQAVLAKLAENAVPHPPSRLCMCADCRPSFDDEANPPTDAALLEAEGRIEALIEYLKSKWGADNVAVQDLEFVRAAIEAHKGKS